MSEAEHAAIVAERRRILVALCAAVPDAPQERVLEIGCGHGHFLNAYAQAHPGRMCLGVDINRERVERAERKRRRAGLENLRFLHADIADFFAAAPKSWRYSDIYILFPDPWPKQRHRKNRLLQTPFIQELAARTLPGGRVLFRTDHAEYFRSARAAIAAADGWRISAETWPFESETVFSARAAQHHSLIAVRQGSGLDRTA